MAQDRIKYLWGADKLVIALGNRTEFRIRALYAGEFLFTCSMATIFLLQARPFNASIFHMVASLGAALLYLLAARRFLSRMFFNERLILTHQSFTLVKKSLFTQQVRCFSWQDAGLLHYEGKLAKTDHPLKGGSFDYFGFETQEHLIQSLHHDGNMFFNTSEGKVYFAPGVFSWHAEEMVQMMKLYAGNALRLGPEWQEMLQAQEFDDTVDQM